MIWSSCSVERVNRPETEAELEAVRRAVQRGQPFGTEAIERYFVQCRDDDLDDDHRWIAALVRALQYSMSIGNKRAALDCAKRHLRKIALTLGPISKDACFAIAYRRTVRQIVRNCGNLPWGVPRRISPGREPLTPA